MGLRLATTSRNVACDALVDQLDAGKIKCYTGTLPGSVGGSYGTLLGTLTFGNPAFGAASSGTATANSITSATAVASGTCQSALITDASDAALMDMDAGVGSGTLNFDNNVIVSGGTIAITSMTGTVPIGS